MPTWGNVDSDMERGPFVWIIEYIRRIVGDAVQVAESPP